MSTQKSPQVSPRGSVINPGTPVSNKKHSPPSSNDSLNEIKKAASNQPIIPEPAAAGKETITPKASVDSKKSNSSDGTKSDGSDDPNRPALDFAKRDVSTSQGRNSYSQLSSMTANSPERVEVPSEVSTDEPVLAADDQERIRNPVGAAFRKSDSGEEIGFRQPFGNQSGSNENTSNSYSSPISATTTRQSSANPSPSGSASRGSGIGTDLTSAFGAVPSVRRTKRYEPARVVLHKSDSGIGANLRNPKKNGESSEGSGGYFDSGIYTAPYSAAGSSSSLPLSKQTSEPRLVPQSLVSSLASSPNDELRAPLKHIREQKQPIYVPAVLRPTDFNNYSNIQQRGPATYLSAAQRKPITQHWVRDANADGCEKCHKKFTCFRRRHHCRKCGGIFCAADTKHTIGLDRILNFNILGIPCRACDSCAANFAVFCLEAPRLQDGGAANPQSVPVVEQEEIDVGGGGDWSTF